MRQLADADVVLAVGTRFVDRPRPTPRRRASPGQTVIQMDIDPEEVGRNSTRAVGIVADAKAGLAALAERVARYNSPRASREAS